jgi:hypothetical protein
MINLSAHRSFATVSSSTAFRMPRALMLSVPPIDPLDVRRAPKQRAPRIVDGRINPFAAAAYFSNGTRSPGDAPSFRHSPRTPVVDPVRGLVSVYRLLDRHAASPAPQR